MQLHAWLFYMVILHGYSTWLFYMVILPSSVTLSMSVPCLFAMYPSTENTTNPAMKLVAQFIVAVMRASLENKKFTCN